MSEARGGTAGRAEMERRIIQRSIEDDAFRQQLLENPKETLEQELETRLPEEVQVVAVEETADTIYLVLPSTPMKGRESVELSDPDLESVAGGGLPYQVTGYDPRYPQYACNDDGPVDLPPG